MASPQLAHLFNKIAAILLTNLAGIGPGYLTRTIICSEQTNNRLRGREGTMKVGSSRSGVSLQAPPADCTAWQKQHEGCVRLGQRSKS